MTTVLFLVLLVLLLMLNVLDHLLTNRIVFDHEGQEVNPVMNISLKLLGRRWYVVKYALLMFSAWCIWVLRDVSPGIALGVLILLNGVSAFVVWCNYSELRDE